MINRINLLLRAKNITAKQFAEEIGIQPSGMSHILGGRNNPSLEFVSKVLRRYPEIDANWLLLGKGEMYASSQSLVQVPVAQSVAEDSTVALTQDTPSLFDETSLDEYQEEPVSQVQDPQLEAECGEVDESEAVSPVLPVSPTPAKGQKLERILFIYSDNTYQELYPRV